MFQWNWGWVGIFTASGLLIKKFKIFIYLYHSFSDVTLIISLIPAHGPIDIPVSKHLQITKGSSGTHMITFPPTTSSILELLTSQNKKIHSGRPFLHCWWLKFLEFLPHQQTSWNHILRKGILLLEVHHPKWPAQINPAPAMQDFVRTVLPSKGQLWWYSLMITQCWISLAISQINQPCLHALSLRQVKVVGSHIH